MVSPKCSVVAGAPPGLSSAPRWLEVGGVRLDLQRRVLRVADRETALSQREFILLGYLMRHAGEVCSRDELLADVWGYGYVPKPTVTSWK
jgi:DNA-binding response OmpR family regulator